MSFGGRLAQFRATQACDPARRAWSSAEEFFAFDWMRPCRLGAKNALPLPARSLRGERAGGVGPARRRRAGYFTCRRFGLNATASWFLVRQVFRRRSFEA